MNCLICGHKLAIFRKLSLGDFCSEEHRALFIKEQNDRGLSRLMESSGGVKVRVAGTRVFAEFLHEEPPTCHDGAVGSLGYGPLNRSCVITPDMPLKVVTRLAPARIIEWPGAKIGAKAPIHCESSTWSFRFPAKSQPVWNHGGVTRLRPAGLILPWSSGAGSQSSFSLSPLVAAVWAQHGNSKPVFGRPNPIGVQFTWPSVSGKVDFQIPASSVATAAFKTVEAPRLQPMHIRLATPSVAAHRPKLELAMPVPARVENDPHSEPKPAAPIPSTSDSVRTGWFASLCNPRPAPAFSARAVSRRRNREEIFSYDEPVNKSDSSREAWQAMFGGWTPSASAISGMFAILFLLSALAIFLSAPSAMSQRTTPSFRWSSLRNAIRSRAVLKVEDDFRSGLDNWMGPQGWSKDWSYDQAGFLRPGKLGFLRESMGLVNYRLELMGQIERKSLGWAFRAKDDSNYYVAKLMVTKPGPLPMVDLVHYLVMNGRESAKVRVTLPFPVRNDTLYQVEMNVRGDQFRASVNGHVVDSWSDNNLRAGGVGFVGGQGEAARVRWIRVSDRDDVLGRICSYLSARVYQPSDDPSLSASNFRILRQPGL